ncbi:uncharacterized protein LOC127595135 [Hippocampus zosterae]|uniref:uncharacterized protein LOC127595135 n=1 Tax=Hippocampus zosterae TaxID=109293 RepID=UPI00223E47F3|nr:uncharacterized protein LOC127595135 [Hippocampus zosterae]
MTSVPKPFKFLKAHYPALEQAFEATRETDYRSRLADFMSGTRRDYQQWGHEYISHLAANIGKEYEARVAAGQDCGELMQLAAEIVPYFIDNNAEHDAIDLLLVIDRLQDIQKYVTRANFSKVNQYLTASSSYSADQDELEKTLAILFEMSLEHGEFMNALRMALKLDDYERMCTVFGSCTDPLIRKQLAFVLARQRVYIADLEPELNDIISNARLSEYFTLLAKDLEVKDPKHPDEIYKTHLEKSKAALDSAKENLSTTYVSAFVNAGLKDDLLMLSKKKKDHEQWIHKTKEDGQIAAVASIGMLDLWDPDTGADDISPYLELQGPALAGAYLGTGLYNAGITSEEDAAKALLCDALENGEPSVHAPAILGLGIAYAGQSREDIQEVLVPIIMNPELKMSQRAFAALALGMIFVGKCNDEVAGAVIDTLIESTEKDMEDPLAKFFAVGLGLIFLGQQSRCNNTLEAVQVVQGPMGRYFQLTIEGLAYAGTGNVLKMQEMMHVCMESEQYTELAVISMALIASGEEIGNEMCHRLINHLLHYGSLASKKMVSIAIALLNLSNPRVPVIDMLGKLCHDPNPEIANRAVLALGLASAGSNNSRVADLLRGFVKYFEPNGLFCVRIAQGLLHMGKGTMTIQPCHSEKFLMNKVAMAGVVTFVHSLVEINATVLGQHHYLMFALSLAMYPKMLFIVPS